MGFWKKLGKIAAIAAPIAAAPFTGGASLALIGAGAGAASGALSGGGLKGALLGAGLGAIPGAMGAGKAAGALAPTLGTGLKQAGVSALTGGGSMAGAGSSGLLKALATNAGLAVAGGVGSALTGAAKGKESERTAADDYGLRREQLGLTAAQINERALADRARLELDQRAQAVKSGESAFQNALRASVVNNFKPAARPGGVSNISFIGGGPSQAAQAAATAMDREAMVRLLEGDKLTPQAAYTPYQLASSATPQQAGTLEKILGIAGTGLSGYSGILKDLKRPTYPYEDDPQAGLPGDRLKLPRV